MKKLILFGMILISGFTFGQKLKKGNTVGVHARTFELNPDFTMEQAQDFLINTFNPVYEKHHPDMKIYSTKGVRGENKDSYGLILVVKSEETLRKYHEDDGNQTELEKSIREKMKTEWDEYNRGHV